MNKRTSSRRNFLRTAAVGLGGATVGGTLFSGPVFGGTKPFNSYAEGIEYTTQNVSRAGAPSDLKITDLRVAVLAGVPFSTPVVRIDTNQGLVGWGDVRDDADPRYALILKSRLLGENPINVEKLFTYIRQFGGHGRLGGGVSGVEMALWDLAGKAFQVPVWQLLGGKYRDTIRLYSDTTESDDPKEYGRRAKEKVDEGWTFIKMDLGIETIAKKKGMITGAGMWNNDLGQYNPKRGSYGQTKHPFTGVQITEKGLDEMMKYYAAVRDAIGMEIPLGSDHFGHFGVNEAIKLAKRAEPYNLAYMEDLVAWDLTDQLKEISEATTTPTMTGEDIYGLEGGFKDLIDARAVDYVHPDIGSTGGLLETKRIGDYAKTNGMAMFLHYAGSPIGAMASAHVAAACENFIALENHSHEVKFWDDLVTGAEKPLVQKGFYKLPMRPGLGVDLNEEVAKQHLKPGTKFFEPTPEWNTSSTSHDRTWS